MEEKSIEYTLAKPGEDKPDIMTKDFDIEVETGLKHDIKKLESKVISITKKIYIIMPNDTEKIRYNSMTISTKSRALLSYLLGSLFIFIRTILSHDGHSAIAQIPTLFSI